MNPGNFAAINWLMAAIASLFAQAATCQPGADRILGEWLKTPKEDLVIQVYKTDNGYDGRIQWTSGQDSATAKGFRIVEGLNYEERKKTWSDGKIIHPKTGSRYSARARIREDGVLELLAYKGLRFIGKKKYFKRVR